MSFVGDGHGGIDKVASSWTLRGWSPPWTRAAVTLRGLKSPSTWMYDSTPYRNHGKNLRVSNFICISLSLSTYILALACFTIPLPHTHDMLVWNECIMLYMCKTLSQRGEF